MEAEKIRNLSDTELAQQQRDQMDQLFRLKFQMKMGQTESLNKIRSLRRGVARLKTIARERALGIGGPAPAGARKAAKVKPEAKAAPVAKAAGAAKTKKKAAKKSAAKTASAKSKAAGKKSGKR
jgi:large subunit ribosomal protein L29